jgi:hypothetical protein
MSENAIDRLKNRQRPKVDKRDASLEQNFELDLEEDVKKTEPNLEINSNVILLAKAIN